MTSVAAPAGKPCSRHPHLRWASNSCSIPRQGRALRRQVLLELWCTRQQFDKGGAPGRWCIRRANTSLASLPAGNGNMIASLRARADSKASGLAVAFTGRISRVQALRAKIVSGCQQSLQTTWPALARIRKGGLVRLLSSHCKALTGSNMPRTGAQTLPNPCIPEKQQTMAAEDL